MYIINIEFNIQIYTIRLSGIHTTLSENPIQSLVTRASMRQAQELPSDAAAAAAARTASSGASLPEARTALSKRRTDTVNNRSTILDVFMHSVNICI